MDWTNEQWLTYYSDIVRREVYRATQALEEAEYSGYIFGNGHHIRQKLAEQAVAVLRERWIVN